MTHFRNHKLLITMNLVLLSSWPIVAQEQAIEFEIIRNRIAQFRRFLEIITC